MPQLPISLEEFDKRVNLAPAATSPLPASVNVSAGGAVVKDLPITSKKPREYVTDPTLALLQCKNAYQFLTLCFPAVEPYTWQIEELIRLSGYRDPYDPATAFTPSTAAPFLYTLNAANGSGKDQYVLCYWALFTCCCKRDFHWIGTSSSYQQLKEQTWKYIQAGAEHLNKIFGPRFLKISKFKIRCKKTGSEITLFRTDEDVKTEGWHPKVKDGQMAIVLNECKSLAQDLIIAFKRCHGYTYWVNISSPGDPLGYFYDKCTTFTQQYPDPLAPGHSYYRRITHEDCPHLAAEFARDVADWGLETPWIQSSYMACFVTSGFLYLVPADRIKYSYPAKNTLGMPLRAGLDLALSGDVTVLSVWQGNHFVSEHEFFERHAPSLSRMLVALIKQMNIPPAQVYGDAGNMGTTIIQYMADMEDGIQINGVHNQSTPYNAKVYKNRGAELAHGFKRLVESKMLNLEGLTMKCKRQMSSRLYTYKEGRIILEDKPTYRGRCGFSPDHFDAAILAHTGVNYYVLKDALGIKVELEADKTVPVPATFIKEWNEVYGDYNDRNTRSDRSAYRTSGVRRRGIVGALQNLGRRLGRN